MWPRRCADVSRIGSRVYRRWISNGSGRRFAALWGNGDYGRLGLGVLDSQLCPAVCKALENQSLRSISCGGAHTLFLTETGRVYATGLNDFGQLGVSDLKSYSLVPVEVSGFPKEISEISAGYRHSSAISVDGELYMWGNNSSGQLGLGKKAAKAIPIPSRVFCLDDIKIKMVSLGSEHSIAVTDEGDVLSWGAGGFGRLGHDPQSRFLGFLRNTSEYTPRLVKKLEGIKVKAVSAGLLHSACVSEMGSIFIFGEGMVYKPGLSEKNNAQLPSTMSELPFCQEVACGGYHTCAISNGGELYTWGSNENGCLGVGCIDAIHVPEKVEGPLFRLSVCQVSCGWKHTAAICDGNVFTWGWGGSHGTFFVDGHSSGGQLGHGDDIDYFDPIMVNFGTEHVKALEISCGFNHTGAILEFI
ncbi:hypothetical protein Sjap_018307 [Stephania japonica]|uniref:RCC1-like domain-containing protein n=1 Tax=Stephania japonica TaxID=461633 RepID=A0AAP0I7U4_9MAGN